MTNSPSQQYLSTFYNKKKLKIFTHKICRLIDEKTAPEDSKLSTQLCGKVYDFYYEVAEICKALATMKNKNK